MINAPAIVGDVDMALKKIQKAKGPIVAGPWLSEIGFELLYWIPFLRWCLHRGYLSRERLWIVSRGGCRSWYSGLTDHYLELFDLYTPDQLRGLNDARIADQGVRGKAIGMRAGQRTGKHLMNGAVDATILQRVCEVADLQTPTICHPSLMYRLFQPYWRKQCAELFQHRTRVKALTPPEKPDGLPDRYVAVKFYASNACSLDAFHRDQVNRIVNVLTRHSDVVLLHTETQFDDHGEFGVHAHQRVHRRRFNPASNLDEQTAIIAHASAFIGTYGGFAYLGPFVGTPTLAFYAAPTFRRDHLQLMKTTSAMRFKVPFEVEPLSNGAEAVRRIFGRRQHAA